MKTIKTDEVYVKKNLFRTLELINIIHETKNSMNVFNSKLDKAKEH